MSMIDQIVEGKMKKSGIRKRKTADASSSKSSKKQKTDDGQDAHDKDDDEEYEQQKSKIVAEMFDAIKDLPREQAAIEIMMGEIVIFAPVLKLNTVFNSYQ